MSGIDWQAIQEDYEGGLSLRALAAKYGVSKSVIGDHKFKEQWKQVRGPDTRTLGNTQEVINRDVNSSPRVADAIRFRQGGLTYQLIADKCGYASPGAARNAIQNELDRIIVQAVDEWRNDHISRLEKMHEEVWEIAMNKEAKGRLFAFDRLLLIAERQAKLLGLDMKAEDAIGPQIIIEEVPVGYLEGPKE